VTTEVMFPPLASLVVKPLHDDGVPLPDGHYWACDWDWANGQEWDSELVHYDWRCDICLTHAQCTFHNEGDSEQVWRLDNRSEPVVVSFSWLIERALHWKEQDDVPET
jgi:hypothetical protein